jgi:hypothetical protein
MFSIEEFGSDRIAVRCSARLTKEQESAFKSMKGRYNPKMEDPAWIFRRNDRKEVEKYISSQQKKRDRSRNQPHEEVEVEEWEPDEFYRKFVKGSPGMEEDEGSSIQSGETMDALFDMVQELFDRVTNLERKIFEGK